MDSGFGNNVEVLVINSVKIEIREPISPFRFKELNFALKEDIVIAQDIQDFCTLLTPDQNFIDILSCMLDVFEGMNNKTLLHYPYLIKITYKNKTYDFSVSNEGVKSSHYFDIDMDDDIFELLKILNKVYEYMLNFGDRSGTLDFERLRSRTELESLDYPRNLEGEIPRWFKMHTKRDILKEDISEVDVIKICTGFMMSQLRIAASDYEKFGAIVDYESLFVLTKELSKRLISPHGNLLGHTAMENLAHEFFILFMNEGLEEGEQTYDEFWTEEDNPKSNTLKLLDNSEELFIVFWDGLINISKLAFTLAEGKLDSDNDEGDDPSPYEPIKV